MSEKPHSRPSIHDVKPIALPKVGHWIGGVVLAIFAVVFLQVLVTNKNMQWNVVAEYMFSPAILSGLGMTLLLTALAMVLGLAIGVVLAIMRLSASSVFQSVSWGWIWFFRGVPPLVQMIFWYNLALLLPEISIGIPFGGPKLFSWNTNELITPFSAAIMGLAFTESAYAAEMIRAGIQAINAGQTEAAATLGMTRGQTLRRIVLPQALRIVIPPIGNDTISMLKFTSLVSVLALPDLLYSAQMVYARTYQTVPLLLVATVWYLVLTTVLTVIEHAVEHRLKSEHHAGKKKSGGMFRLFAHQQETL
ncbi:amino acid ABC transporter permease [Phyllobacterium sp. 21LDTY02-6]|uniref:amino acid ABC transporter permease n=1 Tax=unclassified Phyllobacterium TaxID=2638441 RepID=UPI002021D2C6|nr:MULTISPECIES: amino acid ABC transporter permease [unclassified Phyllobacterium]MCO4317870.1 amino acid ABC transporter permease [Phyllobacterium sp. 21LDTY02-6]MCX8282053.1 amino acid ABC transporter permease [Phyllobacterium sp. 0TCS1.6C]MCX8296255.1 amino acid ABC transporter permease [Phyllobacterium sp. 0TCS1.6A]